MAVTRVDFNPTTRAVEAAELCGMPVMVDFFPWLPERPYPTLTYQPMLELVGLLRRLQFRVYLCSDTSRDFLRTIAAPAYGLSREQVIGSEVAIQWKNGCAAAPTTSCLSVSGKSTS